MKKVLRTEGRVPTEHEFQDGYCVWCGADEPPTGVSATGEEAIKRVLAKYGLRTHAVSADCADAPRCEYCKSLALGREIWAEAATAFGGSFGSMLKTMLELAQRFIHPDLRDYFAERSKHVSKR